jgi:hypothetical protein
MADAATAQRAGDPFIRMLRAHRWALVGVFAAYLLAIVVARRYDVTPTDDSIPLYLTVYIGLVVAPLFLLKGSLTWFHPVVFSSLLRLFDLTRRFSMYAFGLDWHIALPAGRDELSELLEFHLLLHSLALVSYYFGYFLGPRLPVPKIRFGTPRALVTKMLLIWGFALVAFGFYIASRGGLEAHIASWSLGRKGALSGKFYLIALATLGMPACWIWLAYRRDSTRSLLFWGATVVTLAIAFLASGSRSSVVYAAFVGLMIWMLRERRLAFVRTLAMGLVALAVLQVLGDYRRSGWEGESDWESATDTSLVESVTSGGGELSDRTSTSDGAFPIYARVPDDVPLLYGESYLAIIAMPVPRVLWPDKPSGIEGHVGNVFFGVDAGVPPGAVGEAYWNFHVAGVVLVFFLFGVFHRWLARAYLTYAGQPAAMLLYAPALLLFRDPSTPGFVIWAIAQVPVVVILIGLGGIAFGRSRASAAPRAVRSIA